MRCAQFEQTTRYSVRLRVRLLGQHHVGRSAHWPVHKYVWHSPSLPTHAWNLVYVWCAVASLCIAYATRLCTAFKLHLHIPPSVHALSFVFPSFVETAYHSIHRLTHPL